MSDTTSSLSDADIANSLAQALRDWSSTETSDWDSLVEGTAGGAGASAGGAGADLWGSMPTIDSKAVARTSSIFEEYLKRPLDVKLIKPGGYHSVEAMISDIVPKMMSKSSGPKVARATQEVHP